MRIFSTRLVKFEIAHFLCRGVFLKALSENRLNYVQDSGNKFKMLSYVFIFLISFIQTSCNAEYQKLSESEVNKEDKLRKRFIGRYIFASMNKYPIIHFSSPFFCTFSDNARVEQCPGGASVSNSWFSPQRSGGRIRSELLNSRIPPGAKRRGEPLP